MNPHFVPLVGHVTDWVFDLDNCLYPASTGLFELIDERMGAYIERLLGVDPVEAKRIQKAHFHAHGTTLAGLMKDHRVDPHHGAPPGPPATASIGLSRNESSTAFLSH